MCLQRGLLRVVQVAIEQVHEILWIGVDVIELLDGAGRCDVGLLWFGQAVGVRRGVAEDLLLDRALVGIDAQLRPGRCGR